MPAKASIPSVQRTGPLPSVRMRRRYMLDLDAVRPMIRIAHRHKNQLRIARRFIVDHELVLFLGGGGVVRFGRTAIQYGPGSLFYIPPFVQHSFEGDEAELTEHIAIHFDWSPTVPPRSANLERRRPYTVNLPGGLSLERSVKLTRHHRVVNLLIESVELFAQSQPWSHLQASNRLADAITELLRMAAGSQSPRADANQHRLDRAAQFMRRELSRPLSVAEVARAAGLSPSYFRRQFHQWTGRTPLDYLRHQRIARARELLADLDLSIKQVAAAVGFDDPYHFSRSFRQIDGLSPSQFRAAVMAGRAG